MHEDWGSELRSVTEHDVLSRHQTLTSINWPQGPSPRDCHKLTLFSKIVRGLTSIDHILAKHRAIWLTISHVVVDESTIPTVWVKKSPLRFSDIFSQTVGILNQLFLHTYYMILYTLDYKFLFNYFQLWRGYAILSATTRRIFALHYNLTSISVYSVNDVIGDVMPYPTCLLTL